MYLKYFPEDVAVTAMVEITMNMTQNALLRVYEIVELEKRTLTDDEVKALESLLTLFAIAENDVRKMKQPLN